MVATNPVPIGSPSASTTSVRIRESTREQLREIERLTGAGPTEAVARAVDSFRRSIILADTDIAYAEIRKDPNAWVDVEEERAAWDRTLADGLDHA